MKRIILLLLLSFSLNVFTKVIIVTPGGQYTNIQPAAAIAQPGDTIYVKKGVYTGGMFITKLQGIASKYIHILADSTGEAIIRGGSNAIQMTDPKYLIIDGLIFEQQTGNGLNIDDEGTYETPAEHIRIQNCTFRDMNATGNNDLLKMSGVDNFVVTNNHFENGAIGGSGIDMVGCHYGTFTSNTFKKMGSNAIQAKGGTQYILIQGNYFENCGQRTLNLGGSTGLAFFRPIDAKFEAADIKVFSNIFIGSIAPINYVGSVRVDVANNTIIKPEKWVIRILQETVDESRFIPCSDGIFRNNLIYLGNLSVITNVGSNTKPDKFLFKNNYWYNYANTSWNGPDIPTKDATQIINKDPMFENPLNDFRLKKGSPAIGCINTNEDPALDYFGNKFLNSRSAGAIESGTISAISYDNRTTVYISPNPASDYIKVSHAALDAASIKIFNIFGESVSTTPPFGHPFELEGEKMKIDVSNLPAGVYFIRIGDKFEKFVKI